MSQDVLTFSWKGVPNYVHGVEVLRLPEIYTPARRGTTYTVPGADGDVFIPDGGLEPIVLLAEGYLPYEQGGAAVSDLTTIRAWLSGEGWWEQSTAPVRRFWAEIRDSIAFAPVVEGFDDRTFTLTLYADPHQYIWPEARPILLTESPATFRGRGNYWSLPRITITGAGTGALTVNGAELEFAGLAGELAIDSELQACLLADGSLAPSGVVTAIDDFPRLLPGENAVSWSGGVTQVRIEPRWRDT